MKFWEPRRSMTHDGMEAIHCYSCEGGPDHGSYPPPKEDAKSL